MWYTKQSVATLLPYEIQYATILEVIIVEGELQMNERTGVQTKRIPSSNIVVDLEKEFPILRCKQVYWKSALKEILWIMQKQSNNVHDLGSHIWDQWADENGEIGLAYGYQVGKPVIIDGEDYHDQVSYVLETLKKDPSSRRAVINLWDVNDLGKMNLTPCCYSSVWTIVNGRLNCMLVQRSADFLVGVPFNTTQYAMLTYLFADHLGVKPGILTHCMADTHMYMYKSHIEGAEKMLDNLHQIYNVLGKQRSKIKSPKFVRNNGETNFFEISYENYDVIDYNPIEKIEFDVAK